MFHSSKSGEEMCMRSPLIYFNNNRQFPLHLRVSSGNGLNEIVDILMSSTMEESKVCKVQPLGCEQKLCVYCGA